MADESALYTQFEGWRDIPRTRELGLVVGPLGDASVPGGSEVPDAASTAKPLLTHGDKDHRDDENNDNMYSVMIEAHRLHTGGGDTASFFSMGASTT